MTNRMAAAVAAGIVVGLTAIRAPAAELTGASAPLGQGKVESYAVADAGGVPQEIGVAFSAGALDGLPERRNGFSRCFDLDGNGAIDAAGECDGDYENNLAFPAELTGRADIPFDFAMINWNPEGHEPGPWMLPHFDIHFYEIPLAEVDSKLRLGSCGIFLDCEDFERAVKPVPAKYIHPEHSSVGAAVGRMGDHLIDTLTPEFGKPPATFTHTYIFGAYDGSIIFEEVMATQAFLVLGSDTCAPIKQPEARERAGYYPTRYCVRHESDGGVKVFMADFVVRPAG